MGDPRPLKPVMPTVSVNPSPKQRFLSSPTSIRAHREMVDSLIFTAGCDIALLQYQRELTAKITDGNLAGSVGLRLQGAQEFLDVLRRLSETSTPSVPRQDDNLKH
jgi:hypothetical protein